MPTGPRVAPFVLSSTFKSRFRALTVTFCVLVALSLLLVACGEKKEAAKPAPPEVLVAEVLQQDVPVFNEWVAQLNGPVNADITPKVQGYLLKQNYQNGSFVKQGQLLFELDPRQYQAAVEQAQAQLAMAQASLSEADNNVTRDTPLAAQNAIPQKQLDTDISVQQARRAQVEAAKAALDNAKLNLAWTKVFSPIDGIAGSANSQVGDLVGPTTKMVTISQVNPIWAYFSIAESTYLDAAAAITRAIQTRNTGITPVEYIQANGDSYPFRGEIIQVNREVAAGTGTIQFAAAFKNPEAILRPGGFGKVRIKTSDNKGALLVPQRAVIEVQGSFQLVVLSPENRAMIRPVKVGDRIGENWVISEGVKPGEKVVVEGFTKIQMAMAQMPELAKQGVPVSAKPYVAAAGAPGSH